LLIVFELGAINDFSKKTKRIKIIRAITMVRIGPENGNEKEI
jgi:hypothetical protein